MSDRKEIARQFSLLHETVHTVCLTRDDAQDPVLIEIIAKPTRHDAGALPQAIMLFDALYALPRATRSELYRLLHENGESFCGVRSRAKAEPFPRPRGRQ